MKMNTNLKELYLGENNLGMSDANQLGSMLKCNTRLQLLDIRYGYSKLSFIIITFLLLSLKWTYLIHVFVYSNNDIKDVGFNYIIDGIIEQRFGLSVLMVWNNQLTRNIAYTVVRLLVSSGKLVCYLCGNETIGQKMSPLLCVVIRNVELEFTQK